MVMQLRITDSDGSNPIIFYPTTRSVFRRINSSDEGGKFTVPKNAPNADVLNPENGGDTRIWEMWDTETNERINRGPISSITETATDWQVEGRGRSAFLEDFYSTRDVYYEKLEPLVDALRFEYISDLPKASTLVPSTTVTADQTLVFGSTTIDEKYYGVSLKSKDNAIDGQNGPLTLPTIPTYYTTDSFWAGMNRNDAIIVDLGEEFPISKINLQFPWWTGKERWASHGEDYTLAFATSSGATVTEIQGKMIGPFTELYSQGPESHIVGKNLFALGTAYSGYYNPVIYGNVFNVGLDQEGPINIRYIRVNISKVHMWHGSFHDDNAAVDTWHYHCDPNYQVGDDPGSTLPAPGILTENISERDLKPESDCHAGVVELTAAREVFKADVIKPLALQRIDNSNFQIEYHHVPAASEITTTSNGYKHFEPGGFFRKLTVSWSGASTTYTKFYPTDCTNCYPDGWNFGVIDHNATLIYASDSTSGSNVSVKGHMYTRFVDMKGSSTATISQVDAWPSTTDAFSWGSSYSWTDITNDYAVISFRGQSFRWYATIPDTKTAGAVKIEIRSKSGTSGWGAWSTLENSYQLSNGIAADLIYEITYESGLLEGETEYQIKLTNLGGFVSIDSIEGYWSASMTEYNEDSLRVAYARPEYLTQIYDGRFSNGRMYKWNNPANFMAFSFEGDRFILVSAKGRHAGKLTLIIQNFDGEPRTYDAGITNHVFIPGGDITDGSLEINLATGKGGEEIPQYIIFDSKDYFTDGLPWGTYNINLYYLSEDVSTYSAYPRDSDNFVHRCEDCTTPTGTPTTINKYVYFDGAFCHEKVSVTVKFEDQHYLDQLSSIAEVLHAEWGVTEAGIRLEPRIGTDSNVVLREGQNTVVRYQIVHDATKMASILLTSGGDIDGIPLTALTEDRKNRQRLGRSVTRKQDFRDTTSYTQLIGLSRTELKRRRYSEKRMTVSYSGPTFELSEGDTYTLYTRKLGKLRVRIDYLERVEDNSGSVWNMEVSKWPALQE